MEKLRVSSDLQHKNRRLRVGRETLRQLTASELTAVHGSNGIALELGKRTDVLCPAGAPIVVADPMDPIVPVVSVIAVP